MAFKYCKKGYGFLNYDLSNEKNNRYYRKLQRFEKSDVLQLDAFLRTLTPDLKLKILSFFLRKKAFIRTRNEGVLNYFNAHPHWKNLEDVLDELLPYWQELLLKEHVS